MAFLRDGAPSYQKIRLPAARVPNAPSAYVHGRVLTDTIASWLSAGYLAGPFSNPPLKMFRSNAITMVEQLDKVRPCVNTSLPKGSSFNDNVDKNCTERVIMSSARKFSISILEAGKGAVMSKFDFKNAYKNIPCRPEDQRLQGFEWGGRYFVDSSQFFGSISSVCNFDVPGNTICTLTKVSCSIPRRFVHRQLDDVPVVGKANSTWCQEFSEKYKLNCKLIGAELAQDCPALEKAFTNSTKGKVLGIVFDTSDLSWKLPTEKRDEYCNLIHSILSCGSSSLLECQSLLGKLNFVCSMAPFLRSFKFLVQSHLIALSESGQASLPLSDALKRDLLSWWAFLVDNSSGLPIPYPNSSPPLGHVTITTDAAGWSKDSSCSLVGAGGVGLNWDGQILLACQTLWSCSSAGTLLDGKGSFLGSKTTTLELAGMLIPLLLFPESIQGQHVVIQVDNLGCVFGWENGYCKDDHMASILIRCMVLMAAKLSAAIQVKHLPRLSSWEASLADRLSRKSTTSRADLALLSSLPKRSLPDAFSKWLEAPSEDWSLPFNLL